MTLEIKPCIKWAGGKTQLLKQLLARIPKTYRTYYEPFIGGGALLWAVQPKKALINDINAQLINIYQQLKTGPAQVLSCIKQLDSVPCDKDYYLQARSRFNEKIQAHTLDEESAALMIWINKHCFNGLYRVNSKGLFNVPFNNSKKQNSVDPINLQNMHTYLVENNVQIKLGDFETACANVQQGDFVYFDSPYIPMSETANFTSYTKDRFTDADHERLAALFRKLDKIGAKVMLSNNDTPKVHELYHGFQIETFDVHRAINRNAEGRKGQEVIVRNYLD
ncbi:MAG: Site-specific DNA-methyltransferase (adenine-specific) [Succiniclasticum sp.]|jgi:DNA adenine methylase